MLVNIAILAAGFTLLVKGADWLVGSASALARSLGVSDLVIGLTIVAFGTSAPELAVSLLASFQGSAGLSIGNVVGSNTCNILLILGASSIIYPLFAARGTVWKEIPLMLLAVAVLMVASNDALLDGAASSAISRADGLVLLLFFAVFLVYVAQIVANERTGNTEMRPPFSVKRIGLMILGLAMLVAGARLVVTGAVELADKLGMSKSFVGLTVVAIGTSLPEFATSVVAAYRKNSDLAVGNIVGSNIFNVFFILGTSALAAPLPCGMGLNADLTVMAIASILLFLAMFLGKPRHQVQRYEGAFFLVSYAAYLAWLVKRG